MRLAAISYLAKESISRLRTFEASAIWAEDGGRRGSLLIVNKLEFQSISHSFNILESGQKLLEPRQMKTNASFKLHKVLVRSHFGRGS